MKNTLLALLLLFLVSNSILAQEKVKAEPAKTGINYGKTVNQKNAITVKALEDKLHTKDNFSGKVEGTVSQVCKMSGCYLILKSETNKEPIMVRFADTYTVPQDLVGKKVVIAGAAKVRNKVNKDNTNSRTITFIADGVVVK